MSSIDFGLFHEKDPWLPVFDSNLIEFQPAHNGTSNDTAPIKDMALSPPDPELQYLLEPQSVTLFFGDINASEGSACLMPQSLQGQAGKEEVVTHSDQQGQHAVGSKTISQEKKRQSLDHTPDGAVPRRSGRIRKPTESGYQSQHQETLHGFQSAVTSHRRSVTICERTLKDHNHDVKAITDCRNRLETSIVRVSETFHKMVEIDSERYEEFIDLVNERETVNRQILHELTNCLRFIDTDYISAISEKRSNVSGKRLVSEKVSVVNSGLTKSRTQKSQSSRFSSSSHTAATVLKANVAALKAKLQFHDKEVEQKAQLAKLKMVRDIAVEEAKIAVLESSSDIQRQFDPCYNDPSGNANVSNQVSVTDKCNNNVAFTANSQHVNKTVNSTQYMSNNHVVNPNSYKGVDSCLPNTLNASHAGTCAVNAARSTFLGPKSSSPVDITRPSEVHGNQAQYVDLIDFNDVLPSEIQTTQHNVSVGAQQPLNFNAPEFVPQVNNTTTQVQHNKVDLDPHHLHDLFASFSNLVNINRLPIPEPGVFTGDPIQYPSWRRAFQTLIEDRNIPPADRIHYLQRYLKGDAYESVQSLLLIPSDDSYHEAMALIEKRFGNSYTIACAFKSKIENWPKVTSRDSHGLRKFADFLKQCEVAARSNSSLRVLDDDIQNRLMLSKLPDWLVSRWSREVHRVREQTGMYPLFVNFVSFLCREADIACEPLTALQSDKKSNQTSSKIDSKHTSHTVQRTTAKPESGHSSNTSHQKDVISTHCVFCDKSNHFLDKCFKFKAKTLEERRSFIMEKRLCFGCLKPGHSSKQCKRRLQCNECGKRHATPLHGDIKVKPSAENVKQDSNASGYRKPAESSSQDKTKVSLFTAHRVSSKSTMIVPVYISHSSCPATEILTYALLDTQSDTSFITDDLITNLGISGTPTSIFLSTMTCDDKLISCQRVSELSVRAFNKAHKVQLPVLFSRSHIPAEMDNVPSADAKESVRSWSAHRL
jgi:hypothetical protein